MEIEVQTRDQDGALRFFHTVKEGFDHANKNPDVWKVSFITESGEHCRFVRSDAGGNLWLFEPILPEIPRGLRVLEMSLNTDGTGNPILKVERKDE